MLLLEGENVKRRVNHAILLLPLPLPWKAEFIESSTSARRLSRAATRSATLVASGEAHGVPRVAAALLSDALPEASIGGVHRGIVDLADLRCAQQ